MHEVLELRAHGAWQHLRANRSSCLGSAVGLQYGCAKLKSGGLLRGEAPPFPALRHQVPVGAAFVAALHSLRACSQHSRLAQMRLNGMQQILTRRFDLAARFFDAGERGGDLAKGRAQTRDIALNFG